MMVAGAFLIWGGISGRLAKMLAAISSSGAHLTAASTDTGFQQLNFSNIPSGVTLQ